MSDMLKGIKVKADSLFRSRDKAEAHVSRAPTPEARREDGGLPVEGMLRERAIAALKTVYDPEIPVNIYDLGLIYHIDVNEDEGVVYVEMTLTAPGCPVAQTFPGTVESRLREIEGVEDATVKLVWDPPWTTERMSDAVRLQLGML
jgi:FeS assembly SUF system protein